MFLFCLFFFIIKQLHLLLKSFTSLQSLDLSPLLKTSGMNWKNGSDPITNHQCLTSAMLVSCLTFNFKSLQGRSSISSYNPATRFSSCYFICLRTAQSHTRFYSAPDSWQLTLCWQQPTTTTCEWSLTEPTLTHTAHVSSQLTGAVI